MAMGLSERSIIRRRACAIAAAFAALVPLAAASPADAVRVQSRARAADGTLSATQNLSSTSYNGSGQQVAVDAAGNATFVWEAFDGFNRSIQTRLRSAGGALGSVYRVSAAGQN